MPTNCCHVSFAFVLKLLNSLQAFVGVSMVLYSIWMLDQWNHHVPISPPPLAPSPESSVSDSILFNSGPEIGAQSARVFDGLAVGLVSGLDDSVGLNLSSVELPAPWFIYSFMGIGILLCCITLIGCIAAESVNSCCLCFFQYTLLKIALILIEAALVAFIAIDRRWEKDLPFDPTGELDSFRSFVEENIDICKWVGLGVVIIQALALLVAIILRAMVSAGRREIEEEDDYESVRGRTREPLLNPQSSYSSTSAKGDGRGTQSNMWGSRIREKFGLQSGDKYNSLK